MPNVFCSISIECWCVPVSTRWSMLTSNCVVPRSFLVYRHEKQFWTYPYQKYHTPLTFVKPLWRNTGYAIRNVASWVHEFLPSFSTTWRSGQVSLARSPELPKGHDNKGGSFYTCFLAWGKTIYSTVPCRKKSSLKFQASCEQNTIPCTSACTGFSILTCLWRSNERSQFSHSIQQQQQQQHKTNVFYFG